MNDLRTAAQQALEALTASNDLLGTMYMKMDAITALRAALAQQEPVTWGVDWGRDNDQSCCTIIKRHADGVQEVVAVEYGPPRREWRSLSEDELTALGIIHSRYQEESLETGGWFDFARAIEAALKEINT